MRIYGKSITTNEPTLYQVSDGVITTIESGQVSHFDLGGDDVWVAPAFIDVQINGVGGINYKLRTLTVDQVIETTDWIYKTGTGSWCPTVTTSSAAEAIHSLQILAKACEASELANTSFVGFHVEGPYIASEDGPRGAHPKAHTRDPDWDEFCRYQDAAGGRIKILTVAPERTGALAFIERVAETGVIVSIGHTGASQKRIREAIAAGATMSTHLGNGAHATLPRHDNYVWEQLAADELWAGIIPDGHHLPAPILKSIYRIKQNERLCLVSDAAAIAGLPSGIYDRTYGEESVEIHDNGKISLAGTPYLAGAARFLDVGIANIVKMTDANLADAIDMATRRPARLLGIQEQFGELARNKKAHITLFRWEASMASLDIVATLVAGDVVYQS